MIIESIVFPIIILLTVVGVALAAVMFVVMAVRQGRGWQDAFDISLLYGYLIAFATLMMAFFAAMGLLNAGLTWVFRAFYLLEEVAVMEGHPLPVPTPAPVEGTSVATEVPSRVSPPPGKPYTPPPPDFWARRQLAQMLGLLVVAVPAWAFHWRWVRHRAREKGVFLLHRLYLYGAMAVGLIAALILSGSLLSHLLEWLLGTVQWTVAAEHRIFWKETTASMANVLLALALWGYHWRELAAESGQG